MLIPHYNLKFLPSHTVRFWPVTIIFLHNLALGDDAAALAEDGGGEPDLLADHDVVLVVGVVGVPQLPVGPELELQELVPELPLVAHVVPQALSVKLVS